MRSFMEHVPERFQEELRRAIEAVTETRILLDQVQARFGTKEPAALGQMVGQVRDGFPVTPEAVAELEALIALHEGRRASCQALMKWIARGGQGPRPFAPVVQKEGSDG